jgi:hypothetical protein
MSGSETSHSKVALFFSVIFRSFIFFVNSINRAGGQIITSISPLKKQNIKEGTLSLSRVALKYLQQRDLLPWLMIQL